MNHLKIDLVAAFFILLIPLKNLTSTRPMAVMETFTKLVVGCVEIARNSAIFLDPMLILMNPNFAKVTFPISSTSSTSVENASSWQTSIGSAVQNDFATSAKSASSCHY